MKTLFAILSFGFTANSSRPAPYLMQGNPGPDPGSISGSNNEILTTDVNGAARVRFPLTGQPRDFFRAVSLP